jgi:hypothetical protein
LKPNEKDIAKLEKYDASKFALWFRRGFTTIEAIDNKRRLTAFEPLNYFVRSQDDLTGQLKEIYDTLSPLVQDEFRIGIAKAIADLPRESKSFPILRELLYLAGRIPATETVSHLIRRVGNGFFGMPADEGGAGLFALTLNIVAGMDFHDAAFSVQRLAASKYFHYKYAPITFIALCRAEPDKFPEHLALLRSSFSRLHKEIGVKDAYFTAHRFAHYVDMTLIRENMRKTMFDPSDSQSFDSDNWLWDASFLDGKLPSPLILNMHYKPIEENGNRTRVANYIISRRNQETADIQAPINTNTDYNWSYVYDMSLYLEHMFKKLKDNTPPKTKGEKDLKNLISNTLRITPKPSNIRTVLPTLVANGD